MIAYTYIWRKFLYVTFFYAIFCRMNPLEWIANYSWGVWFFDKFIRGGYGFSINLKITFMSSGDKPILTLKISVSNFCIFRYFADFDFKIVVLGQNNFGSIASCWVEYWVFEIHIGILKPFVIVSSSSLF